MMACRHGANEVIACEVTRKGFCRAHVWRAAILKPSLPVSQVILSFEQAFLPMAAIAEQIIKENGFERKIRVVRKRSTEMSIEEDMGGKRANILGKRALARVILVRDVEKVTDLFCRVEH